MAIAGQRFHVDFSSEEEEDRHRSGRSRDAPGLGSLGPVGDVTERQPLSVARPPSAPQIKPSATGFPAHKKRTKVSAFRQKKAVQERRSAVEEGGSGSAAVELSVDQARAGESPANRNDAPAKPTGTRALDDVERKRIDDENKQRLAEMSVDEIEHERQELLTGLSPSLIERLLRRANIDEDPENTGADPATIERPREVFSTAHEASAVDLSSEKPREKVNEGIDAEAEPRSPPADLTPASVATLPPPPQIHFPQPPSIPSLDPSDPSFLSALHDKYFPTFPADPSKLAWMAPLPTESSPADMSSPYSPSQASLPPSALRFDFHGALLPPRAARSVPVTKGLHHHGEAPEAAGYTIAELARLARSVYAAQRCVAFQTLGRMLYRLGKGHFGDEGSDLAMGLWRCVEEGKVVEVLQQEAAREGGHMSAKAYATEAVWMWQKGGGKRWKAQ